MALLFASLTAASLRAQEAPPVSEPTEHHKWLDHLVGQWETSSECIIAPDQPPLKIQGKESVRKLGGYWTMSEVTGNAMGTEFTGVMTLGYDEQEKKYIGTWIDTMYNHMWRYTGAVDESGKKLTLEAEGPNQTAPGKSVKFRDVIEIKSKDHKVMTSSMLDEDGKWVQFMTIDYRRKK
ncbi:MAG: DUF1579 domain-containing protein [Pirellulales bacterium]